MANVSGQVSVAAGETVDVISVAGTGAVRATVSLHSDSGNPPLVLVNDSEGNGVSIALPDSEGEAFQLITDKDPVYVKNSTSGAISLYFYISAV